MRRREGRGGGRVCIVGAGPGDPGLLTRRGAECLAQADVVVYDRLVHPDLLALAPGTARRIYVGKATGSEQISQASINRLLVAQARRGRVVVRLKGGDPFIFGRGGEEALALARAGVPFEVVGGVTSAIAVPAAAGIPLTDRRHASSVAFVTGHEEGGRGRLRVRWDRLATGVETLVLLMAVRQLPQIVRRLVAVGRAAQTPVAVIQQGTTPQQTIVTGTLGTIVGAMRRAEIRPPAIVVIGDVVRSRRMLSAQGHGSLAGCRVLVTRASEQAGALSLLLARRGAAPIEAPLIRVTAPTSYRPLDETIRRMSRYDWVVFTSANGVEAFLRRLAYRCTDIRALHGVRIAAIGPKTASRLTAMGVRVDYQPATFTNAAVARGLKRFHLRGRRVALIRAEEAPDLLPRVLRARGARVDVVPAYRTVATRLSPQALEQARRADVITLTSSSTARSLARWIVPRQTAQQLVVSIGPVTTATARSLGFRVNAQARRATIEGLVEAVEQAVATRRRTVVRSKRS